MPTASKTKEEVRVFLERRDKASETMSAIVSLLLRYPPRGTGAVFSLWTNHHLDMQTPESRWEKRKANQQVKALLILVGGRPIPNAMTVVHEKPDIIVGICSKESISDEWLQLKPALKKLWPAAIVKKETVDAYDVESIKSACERSLLKHPEAEWIVNVTTATSLMTHGAYVAAENCSKQQRMSIKCWFLDTGHTRVIALLGGKRNADIFTLDIEQYITAYNYRLQDAGGTKKYRTAYQQREWMAFASKLGKDLLEISLLKQIIEEYDQKNSQKSVIKGENKHPFLRNLQKAGLISKLREEGNRLHFSLSEEQRKFLNGSWLELYVFQEVQSTGFFKDSLWSKEIIDNDPVRAAESPVIYKDIDVAFIHQAQLMIIECKTGHQGFEGGTLDELVTIADLVGKGAVFKVLVTSQLLPENKKDQFLKKAKSKGVRVIAQDELSQVGVICKELIQTAKHR